MGGGGREWEIGKEKGEKGKGGHTRAPLLELTTLTTDNIHNIQFHATCN